MVTWTLMVSYDVLFCAQGFQEVRGHVLVGWEAYLDVEALMCLLLASRASWLISFIWCRVPVFFVLQPFLFLSHFSIVPLLSQHFHQLWMLWISSIVLSYKNFLEVCCLIPDMFLFFVKVVHVCLNSVCLLDDAVPDSCALDADAHDDSKNSQLCENLPQNSSLYPAANTAQLKSNLTTKPVLWHASSLSNCLLVAALIATWLDVLSQALSDSNFKRQACIAQQHTLGI